jgi:hypothetical protein
MSRDVTVRSGWDSVVALIACVVGSNAGSNSALSAWEAPAGAGSDSESALEAGREADCEQLLWIGASTLTAELGRQLETDDEAAARRLAVSFRPAPVT